MGRSDYQPLEDGETYGGATTGTRKVRVIAALIAIVLVFGGVALAVYFTVAQPDAPKTNMIWEDLRLDDVCFFNSNSCFAVVV
jgi:hypothetical protein